MPSTPKHYAQKLHLLEALRDARPGDPLPTERELAEHWGTSRTTIRQALSALEAEGRILREQGRGTFVAPLPIMHVRSLTSLSEDFGEEPLDSRVLGIVETAVGGDPERDIAAALGLDAGSPVTRVERVRLHEATPLAHEIAHLPGTYPGLAGALAVHGSLYATLLDEYGIDLDSVDDEIGTALAGPEDAERLGVAVGHPLLLVERVARSADGLAREFTRSRFRGDRFRFVAHGQRP